MNKIIKKILNEKQISKLRFIKYNLIAVFKNIKIKKIIIIIILYQKIIQKLKLIKNICHIIF